MLDLSWKNLDDISTIEPTVQVLNLNNNLLTKLPTLFTTLNSLHTLDLSNNAIVSLPAMPRSLKILNLSGNRLNEAAMNECIAKSTKSPWNLEKLWLTNNDIKEFPIELTKLINLEFLSLTKNKIKDIPTQIRSLEKLKFLGLSQNLILDAEAVLLLLPQLIGIGLSDNPLKDPAMQFHRLRHKIKVVRITPEKNNELKIETTAEKLEVQLSRKGTKLLKKKESPKRPGSLAGLPVFPNSTNVEESFNGASGIILEDINEDTANDAKKISPSALPPPTMKTTASMSVLDFRETIDNLVEYYFNSDESLSDLAESELPHRTQMSHRHSKVLSDQKGKQVNVKKSKSENELNQKSISYSSSSNYFYK